MENKDKLRKFKWFWSYMKELNWLEEMALKGWKLYDIRFGMLFYFEACEPVRLLYEVDRFNLPKAPTLKEIRHKEIFMGVAEDMGWTVITHDESQNYYFCKEYVEGEINELYNDEESRYYRAEKYQELFRGKAEELIWLLCFAAVIFLACALRHIIIGETIPRWFAIFSMTYTPVVLGLYLFIISLSNKYYLEFIRMRKGSIKDGKHETRKTVRKLILTNIGLKKYITRMALQGWRLEHMTATRFFFVNEDLTDCQYTMDSKYLTNKRCKALGRNKLEDDKDWMGMNNDWQVQSLSDAEEKGWTFVCAIENRLVIYRNKQGVMPQPLNDAKYDRRPRFISIIGWYSVFMASCGLIGGLIGGIVGAMVH